MSVNLNNIDTEKRNHNTRNIDKLDTLGIVSLINSEDKKVAESIEANLPAIAAAIDAIYLRIKSGGRLVYIGAGTSGRLGVLDSAECPPTFGVEDGVVTALIAGGETAFVRAVEGAEDNEALGKSDLCGMGFAAGDALVGIAASGRTPYVKGALAYAQDIGALTIALSCTKNSEIAKFADIDIAVQPGAEVITGSTRMKSGTAQKMVLNMLSTVTMVKLGKTYGNLMVDVKATNQKLIARAINIVCQATGVTESEALAALNLCGFSAKNAVLMILANVDSKTAQDALDKFEGRIYLALNHLNERNKG